MGDAFIFDTEDGKICGFSSGTAAVVRASQAASRAIYKGLAIVMTASRPVLAATDFHDGVIHTFGTEYELQAGPHFVDPDMAPGFAPFNVGFFDDKVYVTYAKQDTDRKADVPGPGNGFVDVFNPDGTFVRRLVSGGALNSPWGLTMAPAAFGALANTLLVGNFGDGTVHAYDPDTGVLRGTITDTSANQFEVRGLWSIAFGPKEVGEDLFFTAGPSDEDHGVFGSLSVAR